MNVPPPLAIVAIVLAALLPGALALRLCDVDPRREPLVYLFAALAVGLLGAGWLALLLTELGWFGWRSLLGLWLLVTIPLAAVLAFRSRAARLAASPADPPIGDRTKGEHHTFGWPRWGEAALLATWMVAASVLYFRPHEFLTGGADAGVYVSLGAQIARTGELLGHDATLAGLDPSLYPALLRALPPGDTTPYYLLPGFYVPGTPPGLVVPQFYPLHPVWQALGYLLGGLHAELLVTPLWGLLGCLALYFAVREIWGRQAGMLALVALSVTALQVWFARYPTAEMLTQYLFWTAAFATVAWMGGRRPAGLWASLAGAALGELFLARIDMFLLVLPLGAAALWLLVRRAWRREHTLFFGIAGLLAAHSLLHGLLFSRPYFMWLLQHETRLVFGSLPRLLPWLLAAVALLALLLIRPTPRRTLFDLLTGRRRLWLATCAGLVVIAGVYGYSFRPHLQAAPVYADWYGGGQMPMLDRENLVRLGWYLGPSGIALAVAGTAWLMLRDPDRRKLLVLGAGLFFSVLYIWRIQANPHQVYAMRRYVPVVLPFFVLAAACLVIWIWQHGARRGRWIAAALAVAWLSGILWSARGFVSQIDYRDLIAQLDQLDARLAPHSILIFNDPAPVGLGDFVGTPLRSIYGHDVYVLRDPSALAPEQFAAAVAGWQRDGRHVYWMASPGGYAWPGASEQLQAPQPYAFSTRVLENTYERKPQGLVDIRWDLLVTPVTSPHNP